MSANNRATICRTFMEPEHARNNPHFLQAQGLISPGVRFRSNAAVAASWHACPTGATIRSPWAIQEIHVPDHIVAGSEKSEQFIHSLANGMTLLAERIPAVRSAAMTLLVPTGAAFDPDGQSGNATVLAEWILRGAGSRDSRALTSYLDGLGVQRSAQAETVFIRFSASMLGKNLLSVLPVYADIVERPLLPDDGFAPSVDLAQQQLDAIEDEPSHKLSLLLRERHFPFPYGRPTVGRREDLERITPDVLRTHFLTRVTPQGAILAVAGMFNWNDLVATVETAFGPWAAGEPTPITEQPAPRGTFHVRQKTNQSQIGLAWDAIPDSHPDSVLLQSAMNVLSGSMGARLFTEIREKQGLCYAVHASYASLKKTGAVLGYSGTSPDRAQRTLDSFITELQRLSQGVTAEELDRAKIGMKSRVIMQGESSGARAGAIAYDYYHRGRTRTLDELRELIESVTLDRVNDFLAAHPIKDLTVVTIGPDALTTASAVSKTKPRRPATKSPKAAKKTPKPANKKPPKSPPRRANKPGPTGAKSRR
jgi:predicted Zn-dependent peptidase